MSHDGYGRTVENRLRPLGAYTRLIEDKSGKPFLTVEEYSDASKITVEKDLVAFLIPILQKVCDEVKSELICVNSETIPWLKTDSGSYRNDLKPDFTVIHRAMVQALRVSSEGVIIGRPKWNAIEALRVVGKAKIDKKYEGFGEICLYTEIVAQQIAHGKKGYSGTIRGIAIDRTSFILVETNCAGPVRAIEGNLGTLGSYELFQNFFSRNDPLTTSFMRLCHELGVKEHYISAGKESRSLLGKGFSGRAFVVKGVSGTTFVLKVVITDLESSKTEQEFDRLLVETQSNTPHVVRVVEGSFKSGEFEIDSDTFWSGASRIPSSKKKYYGYLMEDVGAPIRYNTIRETDRTDICKSLNALHVRNVYHGDARIPNVVKCEKTFKWIDFHHMIGASPAIAAIDDVNKLMISMFPSQEFPKGESYQKLLKSYGKDQTFNGMKDILKFYSPSPDLPSVGDMKLSGDER